MYRGANRGLVWSIDAGDFLTAGPSAAPTAPRQTPPRAYWTLAACWMPARAPASPPAGKMLQGAGPGLLSWPGASEGNCRLALHLQTASALRLPGTLSHQQPSRAPAARRNVLQDVQGLVSPASTCDKPAELSTPPPPSSVPPGVVAGIAGLWRDWGRFCHLRPALAFSRPCPACCGLLASFKRASSLQPPQSLRRRRCVIQRFVGFTFGLCMVLRPRPDPLTVGRGPLPGGGGA